MKLKHIIYILLIGGFFTCIHLHLKNQRESYKIKRNTSLNDALNNVDGGEKINLFFVNSFDKKSDASKLYKVASKTNENQYSLLSKSLNKLDRNVKEYTFGDLIMLDFEDEQIIDGHKLKNKLLFDNVYLNWTLPPKLRKSQIAYPLRKVKFSKFSTRLLHYSHDLKFLLISTFVLSFFQLILQYFIKKIKTRKLDFVIYTIAITFAFKFVHVIEFGNHISILHGASKIEALMFSYVTPLTIHSLIIVIPLFIVRYFYKIWKPNIAFEEKELIKAIVALFFGSIFIVLYISLSQNSIQQATALGGQGRSYSFIFTGNSIPYYISIIPLIAIVSSVTISNFITRAFSSWNDSEALIRSNAEVIKIESKLNEMQSSVNPHFLYNSFNSIASLAKKDPEKTEKMTLALSSFYKYVTNRDGNPFSTIGKEIEMIQTYLDIEKIRFEDRLQFELDIQENLINKEIPNFLLQPLVENAIKYGYNKSTDKIQIKIQVAQIENDISIQVYDQGEPFDENLDKGYGLRSVTKKLELLYPDRHDINFNNNPKHVSIILKAASDD